MLHYQSFAKNATRLLIALLFIHLGFGFLLNFSVDEAHYALYGLHLDWSYFDHPPLVGWLQSIPIYLGAPDGLLRLIPESLWLLSILLAWKVCETIIAESSFFQKQSEKNRGSIASYAKWFTAIIIMTAPILHVLAVGLLPDTLLIVLVPLMQLLTLKINQAIKFNNPRELSLWIALGLVLGLAGLSKYTSIFSALAIALCLFSWQGSKLLKHLGLWVCLLIAAILISPIIYWNWQHDWISFIYQIKHGSGSTWQVRRLIAFILNQLVTYGALPIIGVWLIFKNRFDFPKLFLSFFIVPFAIFLIMSGGGGSLPHWTSPAWLGLAPIAGIGLGLGWVNGRKLLIKSIITIQLGICTLGFVLLFFGGIPGSSKDDTLGKSNPIADLYGWKEAGNKAIALAKENNISSLAVNNWTLASRLAWYAKPFPVFVIDQRFDQFDIWFGSPKLQSNAIYVNWSQMPYQPPVGLNSYKTCKIIDKLDIWHLGRIISSFEYFLCEDWTFDSQSNSRIQ